MCKVFPYEPDSEFGWHFPTKFLEHSGREMFVVDRARPEMFSLTMQITNEKRAFTKKVMTELAEQHGKELFFSEIRGWEFGDNVMGGDAKYDLYYF